MEKHILVPEEDELGLRLDKFLTSRLAEYSRSFIQKLIANNNVINKGGSIISDSSYKITMGEYIVKIPEALPTHLTPYKKDLEIVYEDSDLLIINKPANLVTHPGAGNRENTLANALINYLDNNLSSIGGVERPGILHRLDKDTSGLIIIAKTNHAHVFLSEELEKRNITRIYHALIWKVPTIKYNKISTYIRRSRSNRIKMETHLSDGKLAITHYKILKQYNSSFSLVECKLETGRTHQIRVHLSYIKHPIIGDQLYGSDYNNLSNNLENNLKIQINMLNRQALHAKKISFTHPTTHEFMEFEIDYPDDMKKIIKNFDLA